MATFSSTPIVIDGKGHLLGSIGLDYLEADSLWPENRSG